LPRRPYKGLETPATRRLVASPIPSEEHLDSLVREKQVNHVGSARILLVGERKSGKTTCCMTAARMLREKGLRPGGVVCPKLIDRAGEVIGIEALNLLDDPPSRAVLARTDVGMDGPSTGAYHFSEKGLRFGREALEAGARLGNIVFADELGPLEIRGEGFSNLIDLARNPTAPPMVIVVRRDLVSDVCKVLAPISTTVLPFNASKPEETPARLLELLQRLLLAT
jgi:nucleoside-triphosphatase THEP1